MDCDSVDMVALDYGYEVFYTMLTYEVLAAHAMKLVYNLTKPVDVTRRRVLELLDYSKKREAKKNLYRQLQVLLGLFKSYKPECVPEDVPSISIHTSFRKINTTLLRRFKQCHSSRNNSYNKKDHLLWTNLISSESGRNKKVDPLVPNMEFLNIALKQYEKSSQKNYLDFSDPVSLLEYSVRRVTSRPARLRALLCNDSGLTQLALASGSDHAFFSHDLHHLLTNSFLDTSPYNYAEKRDLLHKLAKFQRTILQGVPVVTRFLAQFLPFWNEQDFFAEIMDLIVWISVDCLEHIISIMDTLKKIYYRAEPIEQCAILMSLTQMYANLVFSSTRKKQYFMNMDSSRVDYPQILRSVASSLSEMSNKVLQINPGDMRALYSGSSAAEWRARVELRCGRPPGCVPGALSLALPLLTPSAALLDSVATLLVLYRKITMSAKKSAGGRLTLDAHWDAQLRTLKAFTSDMVSCLYHEGCLANRKEGLVFARLHPQLAAAVTKSVPDAEAVFSVRNHLAFAPYTYAHAEGARNAHLADNALWFGVAVDRTFPGLAEFLSMAVPQLRVGRSGR
ncbi:unnamed protein product, partial [Iphiclides podalirius]